MSRRWPRQRVRGVSPADGAGGERRRVEGGAAVGAVGAQQRGGDGQLERPVRVVGGRRRGRRRRTMWCASVAGPDVDLDAAAEPVDVGAQHPVVGERRAPPRPACARAWSVRRPTRCGRRRTGARRGAARRRSARRRAGRRRTRRRTRRVVRRARRPRRGRRRRPRRACRRPRPGATRTGPGLRQGPGRRRAPGALRGVPCWWRPGTPRTGPAGAAPARLSPSTTSSPERSARVRLSGSAPRLCGGGANGGDVTGVVGGGDQQQGLHVGRQPAAAVQEDPFHAGGELQLGGHRRGAGELLARTAWWGARRGRAGSRRPGSSAGPRPRRARRRRPPR